jgi:hypothetical protein
MKRIGSIIIGSLFAALFAGGALNANARAQTEPGVIFTVPFAFTADGHSIAAGTYEINLISNQYLMSIRNVQTGKEQFFTVLPQQQRTIASQGLLVFHGCGPRKNLTEFHIPGSNLYSTTIAPRHAGTSESESCSPDATTTIAAR